jgi:predicted aspartyl protease
VALVDTGSTHTFIREAVATQLGLQVALRPGLSIKAANRDNVASSGIYPKLRVTIAEETFNITCYVLPLASFNIVLGVQCLRSLGPILWNFNALSMEFWRLGRKVRWVGLGAPHTQCANLS